jgi:undecaprenyl-diphosphatase
MDLLRIVILAVVQGLTEFLPISSDGHLLVTSALFEAITGRPLEGKQLTLTIVLHAGTLVTVLVVFRRQLLRLLTTDRRVIPLLIVGTVPVGVLGLALEKWCEPLLESPLAAGVGLIITGFILLWGVRHQRLHGDGEQTYQQLSYAQSIVIGTFQAVAALPGISRSGSTIASGLALCGLRRSDAANFSFLLSVPAIGGVVFVKVIELWREGSGGGYAVGDLVVGAVVSCVVGFAALKWLLSWLRHGKLHYFAWWCIPLGIVVTVWQWLAAGS